jgi:molecular chaperone GrpE
MADEETKVGSPELTGDGLGDESGQAADVETTTGDELLAEAQTVIADLNARLFRAQADFENYRRRVQKEKEDLAIYANQKLVLNLLPVLDNLDRALGTEAAIGDEKLRQGVELTARSFRDILVKEGVTTIDAVGQPFDPNLHEGIMTVESTEHPDGTVVAEFQRGYRLGGRVIRPAMVQVSKA